MLNRFACSAFIYSKTDILNVLYKDRIACRRAAGIKSGSKEGRKLNYNLFILNREGVRNLLWPMSGSEPSAINHQIAGNP